MIHSSCMPRSQGSPARQRLGKGQGTLAMATPEKTGLARLGRVEGLAGRFGAARYGLKLGT